MPLFRSDPAVEQARYRVRMARQALRHQRADIDAAKADLAAAKLDLKDAKIQVREHARRGALVTAHERRRRRRLFEGRAAYAQRMRAEAREA